MVVVSAATHKLMVWVDMRSTLTPGQKYVYWEKAGVHLRIEIGMREVKSKMCKVVKSSKPEDYSSVVKVDSPLLGRALLKTLKKLSPVELEWLEVPTAPPSEDDDDDNLLINIQERIRISKLKESLITPGVAGEGSVAAELSSASSKRALATGVGAIDSAPPTKRRKEVAAGTAVVGSDASDDDDSSDSDSSSDDGSDSDDSSHGKEQKPSRKHQRGSSGEDSDTTSSGEDASDDSGSDSDDSADATEDTAHEDETSVQAPAQGAVASDTSSSDDDGDDNEDDDDGNSNKTDQSVLRQNTQPQKRRMDSGDALSDDGFDNDDDDSTAQPESIESVAILPAPTLPDDASSKRPVAKKGKAGRARGAVVRF